MDRYLIIASQFNEMISTSLLNGAEAAFNKAGIAKDCVDILWVPGAFEIPVVAAKAARTGRYCAVICLGAVIRGDPMRQCLTGFRSSSRVI